MTMAYWLRKDNERKILVTLDGEKLNFINA